MAPHDSDSESDHNSESDHQRDWREAIWSVPGPFILLYFALVTVLGLPTLTVIIWEKAQTVSAPWWLWHTAVIRAAAPECGVVGVATAIYALLLVQGVAFLMVMYQFAVNKWVKPVIRKHQDAGRAQGRAQGHAEGREEGHSEGLAEGLGKGRTEANQAWESWLERKTDAESKGLPFDEPRPGNAE